MAAILGCRIFLNGYGRGCAAAFFTLQERPRCVKCCLTAVPGGQSGPACAVLSKVLPVSAGQDRSAGALTGQNEYLYNV